MFRGKEGGGRDGGYMNETKNRDSGIRYLSVTEQNITSVGEKKTFERRPLPPLTLPEG